ncbi:unnamed protein product [Penicillium camemberti]|uniref:Str. FM013 n=1 Tax=Penicillium camemberti (strain FM 013) TaxID=1429867 RepID=A0A0G4PSI1_PENC3|nr:unnamed protein product [Penicillium camemberti]
MPSPEQIASLKELLERCGFDWAENLEDTSVKAHMATKSPMLAPFSRRTGKMNRFRLTIMCEPQIEGQSWRIPWMLGC